MASLRPPKIWQIPVAVRFANIPARNSPIGYSIFRRSRHRQRPKHFDAPDPLSSRPLSAGSRRSGRQARRRNRPGEGHHLPEDTTGATGAAQRAPNPPRRTANRTVPASLRGMAGLRPRNALRTRSNAQERVSAAAPKGDTFTVCMHREEASTVSYTAVHVAAGRVFMAYLAGAPCQGGEPVRLSMDIP